MSTGHKQFFTIDERTGKLWKIPPESLLCQLYDNRVVPKWRWRSHFVSAHKDANTFLTAEVMEELCNPGLDSLPTHVFKSTESGCVVYARNIRVEHNKWQDYGASFYWPISFEEHEKLCYMMMGHPELTAVGALGYPELPKLNYERRPSPECVMGATMVGRLDTELGVSERHFYLNACCAPYLFRDCSHSLEQYWKSAKRHKEHHPDRLALKCRLQREEERRRMRQVHTLLERSQDPVVVRTVVNNAKRGIKVLNELMDNAFVTQYTENEKLPKRQFTSFLGEQGLPLEIQSMIIKTALETSFAVCDAKQSFRQFKSLRLVSKDVAKIATESANSILRDAASEASGFVDHGTAMSSSRMHSLHYWTYRELGCSPNNLLELVDGTPERTERPLWQLYFDMRTSCNIAANVCRQRAIDPEEKRLLSKSERVQKLKSIVLCPGS